MNTLLKSLTVSLILSLGVACTKTKPPREISSQELIGLLNNGFALVTDVRETTDEQGVIAGAMRIPLSDAKKDGPAWTVFVSKAPKDKTLVFYGTTPEEGRRAAEIAAELGHTTAYLPSFADWISAKAPTAPASTAPCASARPGDPLVTSGACRPEKK